jgi:plasmid stability protein
MLPSGAMPRTTFDVDASVLTQLRQRAAHEGKSMGQLASELLAQQLAADDSDTPAQEFRWTSRGLGVPRVDLEDTEALHALLNSGA